MWILNYVTQNSLTDGKPEQGSVEGAMGGKLRVNGSSDFSTLPIVAPYGITFVPPVGERSVVLNAGGEDVCLGTLSEGSDLKPGELRLSSLGGASIELKNDGNVYINGVRFE